MTIPIDQLTTNALAAKIDGAALRKMDAKGVRALLGKVDAKIVFDLAAINGTEWVALTPDPASDWTVEA